LLAATSDGLYKTINGGNSWTLVNPGRHFDIEFRPDFPDKVYATNTLGFSYSNDAGDTWNNNSVFDHPLCNERVEIGVTAADNSKVYLFAGPKGDGNYFCGFFESNDGGANFTRKTNSPNLLGDELGYRDQSDYDLCITVSPTDEDLVFVGGIIIWKTTDGGSTAFTNCTTQAEDGGSWYVHCDIHDLAINPLNDKLYAVTDGGVYVSTDSGDTWVDLKEGVCVTQSYYIDDYDANSDAVLIGSQDNGIKYKNNDDSFFSNIGAGDGFDVIINYSDQTKGYAVVNKSIFIFNDFLSGTNFKINNLNWFPQIEMNTSDTAILYFSNSNIFKYNNTLQSIEELSSFLNESGYWALKTCKSNSNRIYAAGGNELFSEFGNMHVSSDQGNTWTLISENNGFPENYPRISRIGVRPNSSNMVYAVFSGYVDNLKIYYSNDAGLNWSNISYDLPNIPILSIEVDSYNNVYVGTDIGVYFKTSGATNWEPFYNNLPNVPISDLAINEVNDKLLASTFGRGVWKSTLHTSCPNNLWINDDLSGRYFRSVSNDITLTGKITGGAGTEVIMRAGSNIDLKPGFRVNGEPGTNFLAYIGDCGDGLPPEFGFQGPPAYPNALSDYNLKLSRNKGTLQILNINAENKIVRLRKFTDGDALILLLNSKGELVNEVARHTGENGVYDFNLNTRALKGGLYFVYLIVDDDVTHLQELVIPGKSNTD